MSSDRPIGLLAGVCDAIEHDGADDHVAALACTLTVPPIYEAEVVAPFGKCHPEQVMDVIFRRTGARRYAVSVRVAGQPSQGMDPAPGFDEHIPHDLVHYVVESELQLMAGVFGRAASGGGNFYPVSLDGGSARERARQQRKQRRREGRLASDEAHRHEMAHSERLAGLCDLAWRRRHGQRPDPARWQEGQPSSPTEHAHVQRVLTQLDRLAPIWHALPVDGELVLTWPQLVPTRVTTPVSLPA
jgi:hypothetical protein